MTIRHKSTVELTSEQRQKALDKGFQVLSKGQITRKSIFRIISAEDNGHYFECWCNNQDLSTQGAMTKTLFVEQMLEWDVKLTPWENLHKYMRKCNKRVSHVGYNYLITPTYLVFKLKNME